MAVWSLSGLGKLLEGFDFLLSLDILYWFQNSISHKDFEFVCILLWFLWFDCNWTLHSGLLKDVTGLLNSTTSLLSDYQSTLLAVSVQHPASPYHPSSA
ncbi:hypothetical protein ACOSQ4_010038 [Xanthoceras sorbifolium]